MEALFRQISTKKPEKFAEHEIISGCRGVAK
jgi:hypothetical protein